MQCTTEPTACRDRPSRCPRNEPTLGTSRPWLECHRTSAIDGPDGPTLLAFAGMRLNAKGWVLVLIASVIATGQVPDLDSRNTEIRHTDRKYSLPKYSKSEWEDRSDFLRKRILFSSGLLPLPAKEPLNPLLGDVIEHADYSVASVLLETYPGYFLGGNLYRPVGRAGPHPAVVSPHGHWRFGRFENSEINSVPSRAINFARQGYVVFAYDMVGWNDTMQTPHAFGGPVEDLWLFGPLGLQLWNSIRVVDYLAALPDVDSGRIGVTGASGGATQAFLLAAVDNRVGYSAPVNMVSFQMQGGSPCENAPLLRIDANNVEFSAAFAPKPQLLVAATGDWTVNVPTEEFPAVQAVYRLLDAESNVEFRQFDSPHNYHRDSREAVYGFFGKHILGAGDEEAFSESSVRLDQLSSLLYLWGRSLPDGAVGFEELVRQRIAASEADTLALGVRDANSLARAKSAFGERLSLALLAEVPSGNAVNFRTLGSDKLLLGRKGVGDRIPGMYLNADSNKSRPTLVVDSSGMESASGSEIVRELANRNSPVLLIDPFQTGSAVADRDIGGAGRRAEQYYHVFNRSDDANRVQDILTAAAFLRETSEVEAINLVGRGRGGLWVLLAAALDPAVRSVVADLDQFDATDDSQYVERLFIPGLRRAGDFRAVAALVTDARVLLHNSHAGFPAGSFQAAFKAVGRGDSLAVEDNPASVKALVDWLGN